MAKHSDTLILGLKVYIKNRPDEKLISQFKIITLKNLQLTAKNEVTLIKEFEWPTFRLFYLLYVMVELMEELAIEGDMELDNRVNPE